MHFAIFFRFTVLHFEKQLVVGVKYRRIRIVVNVSAIHIKINAFLNVVDKFREITCKCNNPSRKQFAAGTESVFGF